uniref:Nucleotidyl transferase domain-containing protein n=1 Tax=Musa acuminata subsp. malaccensis TaxID=214687 RepID=A0A804IHE9_MUSAM
MKALVLVGGFETSLKPLTLSMPKSLLILHQVSVGVTEVILAINYQPQASKSEYIAIFLKERSCLGEPDKPFFLLNSDIVCEYPLKEVLSFHQAHGGEASIMVTKVAEPSKYGVVLLDEESGQVKEFVEKPPVFVGNRIDAGIYLPSIDVLSRVLPRLRLLERQVFPSIAAREACTPWFMPDFWMDMGQPKDYLAGLKILPRLRETAFSERFGFTYCSLDLDLDLDSVGTRTIYHPTFWW